MEPLRYLTGERTNKGSTTYMPNRIRISAVKRNQGCRLQKTAQLEIIIVGELRQPRRADVNCFLPLWVLHAMQTHKRVYVCMTQKPKGSSLGDKGTDRRRGMGEGERRQMLKGHYKLI